MIQPFLTQLAIFTVIYLIYFGGKLTTAVLFGIHDNHIILGFGNRALITFKIKKLTISLGWFIPFPFLARYHKLNEGRKEKPNYAWQFSDHSQAKRLLVIWSGTLSSLFIAMILFTAMEYHYPRKYLSKEELNKHGIIPNDLGKKYGFERGDKIISVNDNDFKKYSDLVDPENFETDIVHYAVDRHGDKLTVSVSTEDWSESDQKILFSPDCPFEVQEVIEGSKADIMGMQKSDRVWSINGHSVFSFYDFKNGIESAGDSVDLVISRDGQLIDMETRLDADKVLGFYPEILLDYSIEKRELVTVLKNGISMPFQMISSNIKGLLMLINTNSIKANNSLSGPIDTRAMLSSKDLRMYFTVLAMLLSVLPFYELLPLPRTASFRSFPVLLEIVGIRMTLKNYWKVEKFGWILIFGIIFWQIIQDVVHLI